ncbi:MAG: ribosome biogenesis/translation initiation ATPase RLI [Conexivisphaerales archaeon]|nr:ribosome biogenesis/translation initiation ATPase RLI [Conexivisphaerales archaeon]
MVSLKVAVINKDVCRFDKCNHECQRFCPPQISGKKVVEFGPDGYPTIDEVLCIGCGICEKKCPFEAIRIVNLPSEYGKEKVHQYGPNAFRLYRLPILKKGKVVGAVGMNGIGKSTALKILSGAIIPNLGNYEKEPSFDDVIKYFKGTVYADYFRALKGGEIKISIKPQAIYEIPKVYKGSVKDLLEKYSEGENSEIVRDLEVEKLYEKQVSELSGGELQKVAIIISLSRKADYYFLDEPSSYLDVFNRHSVAKVIKKVSENAGVFLVEHDLTFLDYASDYIHILYGEPAVYGIVSRPMNSSEGINALIDGEIRQENVRIRSYNIRFRNPDLSPAEESNFLFTVPSFRKSYPGFILKVEGKEVKEGQIIGGLGPNGIGKTTFLKVLAGVEKDDEGAVNVQIKISYKPQYLEINQDVTVESVLSKFDWNSTENMNLLITPLRIEKLMQKNLSKLSGGELQKVAIATALLQDATLYALDEPSAFLDVEDRIALSKILPNYIKRKGRAGIIIDHDLMLIDLISDSIMVFKGIPNVSGEAIGPLQKREAMNSFLKEMGLTYRRDEETGRPRVNKPGSKLDREQKEKGEYYYV